jgi:hypothetical protein
MNELLRWFLAIGAIAILSLGIFGGKDRTPSDPAQNESVKYYAYTEELRVEMPNGCSMFAYTLQRAGSQWIDTGRYILCGSGAQTANTHQCGKQCHDNTAVVGDPLAIKRAHAISKLTDEERKLLDIK